MGRMIYERVDYMSKKVDNIIVFSGAVARDLLREGYNIIDISADHKNKLKTVFYFNRTEQLENYLWDKHKINVK